MMEAGGDKRGQIRERQAAVQSGRASVGRSDLAAGGQFMRVHGAGTDEA